MTRLAFLLFALLPALSTAQITADTLWLHRASATEEDVDSYFPILKHKNNPSISNLMNTALQMQALGFILNQKNKASFTNVDPSPTARTNYSFYLKRMTDRLFYVDFSILHVNNTMSLNGWDETRRFYFDATSGQPVSLYDIFSPTALQSQSEKLEQGFRAGLIQVMQRYQEGFSEKNIPGMEEECECHCIDHIRNAWCAGKVRLDFSESKQTLDFSIDDCDWMNPRSHDSYSTSVDYTSVTSWLTPYGKFLLHADATTDNTTVFKMWKGTIGATIPVTFIVKIQGCQFQRGAGVEIYDKFGTSIPLTFDTKDFPIIRFAEIGNNGKAVATIEAKLVDGKLTGTWMKADKSKALPFEASVGK